ncbi:hypothetical protein [Bacillus cereus group sp. N18]|nr:hypothetical protein [Bacillus cereus group sp. N18]
MSGSWRDGAVVRGGRTGLLYACGGGLEVMGGGWGEGESVCG